MITIYKIAALKYTLDQGCPTRGPRTACGQLDNLVRPFLLLSSFTPFCEREKNFWEGKFFHGRQIELRGQATGRFNREKMTFSKKVIKKVAGNGKIIVGLFAMSNFAALLKMVTKTSAQ